jgi:hypothetical protein
MIRLLIAGLLLVFTVPVRAQEIVAALNLDKREPTPLWFEYVRADQGLVTISYLTRQSSREVGLFKYNAQLKREWNVLLFEQNGRMTIEQLAVLGERILIFVAERFPREKNTKLFFYEYNLDGQLITKGQEFYQSAGRPSNEAVLTYITSINQRKLLCFDNLLKKSRPEEAQFFIFDADDAGIEGNRIKFPYPDNRLQLRDVKVGNNGNLFVLARLEQPSTERSPDGYAYLVFQYDLATEQLDELELPFQSVFVTDLILKPDRANNVLVGGFYSRRASGQVAGVLYAFIDWSSQQVLRHHIQDFDAAFLAKYLSTRQIEKGRELADFYLDDLVLRSDGGMLILAEQYYITSSTYRDVYGFWYTNDLFNYEDVAIVSLSPLGQIEWTAIIDKAQASDAPVELSYLPLVGESSLLIFYKARLQGFGHNVYFQRVDYDGTVSTPRAFFPKFGSRDVFYRRFSEQTGNREAIFVYYQAKGRIFTLAKVVF